MLPLCHCGGRQWALKWPLLFTPMAFLAYRNVYTWRVLHHLVACHREIVSQFVVESHVSSGVAAVPAVLLCPFGIWTSPCCRHSLISYADYYTIAEYFFESSILARSISTVMYSSHPLIDLLHWTRIIFFRSTRRISPIHFCTCELLRWLSSQHSLYVVAQSVYQGAYLAPCLDRMLWETVRSVSYTRQVSLCEGYWLRHPTTVTM